MRRVIPLLIRGALPLAVLLIVAGGALAAQAPSAAPAPRAVAGEAATQAEAQSQSVTVLAEHGLATADAWGDHAAQSIGSVQQQGLQAVSELSEPVRQALDDLDAAPGSGMVGRSRPGPQPQALVEDPVPEADAAWAVVAAAGMGGAVFSTALLSRTFRTLLLFPLLSRITRSEIFDNDARRLVAQLVQATPGLCLNDMVARTGYSRNAVSYHLFVLEKEEEVVSLKDGKYRRYFPRGGRYVNGAKNVVSALRNDVTLRMAQHVVAHPGAIQRELCRVLSTTPSAACWHAKRLENLGVIRKERVANTVQYYPGPALSKYDLSEFGLGAPVALPAPTGPAFQAA